MTPCCPAYIHRESSQKFRVVSHVDGVDISAAIVNTRNDNKPKWVIERVKAATSGFACLKVAYSVLAFKPDIDDLRESPSLEITVQLTHEIDGQILATEPCIDGLPSALNKYKNVEFRDTERAIVKADIALLLVNHEPSDLIDQKLFEGKIAINKRGMWY